jgi:AcrR family transcriptional regulator
MFGKPGRPPEDRIQRRGEIWAAVSPLIEKSGARSLTMREAAAASFLSLGGLYHYFPDKRSLVLYGLDQGAHERVCLEFKARYGHLKDSDPHAAAEAFIHFFGDRVSFVRPAIRAALELGQVSQRPPEPSQSSGLRPSHRRGLDPQLANATSRNRWRDRWPP